MQNMYNKKSPAELNELSLMIPVKDQPDISSPEELFAVVSDYFELCKIQNTLPTMTGLALTLGTTRKDLMYFCSSNPKMQAAMDQAKLIIIEYVERMLISGRPPIGLIFWLKNNDDWIDKTEVTHSDKKISDILDDLEQKGDIIKGETS